MPRRFPYRTQREIGKSSWFGMTVFREDWNKPLVTMCEHRPVVSGNFLRQPVISHYNYEVFGELKNADYIHDNARMIGNGHEAMPWAYQFSETR
jgi:CDP-6-deoxy-D-xylo-4-hexulose-3-dehydrase